MARKKKKTEWQVIQGIIEKAMLTFGSYDFEAEHFKNNGYQIRIRIPNYPAFFDWYFTTGTLVITREERTPAGIGRDIHDAEEVAQIISKKIEEDIYANQ